MKYDYLFTCSLAVPIVRFIESFSRRVEKDFFNLKIESGFTHVVNVHRSTHSRVRATKYTGSGINVKYNVNMLITCVAL